MYYVNHEQIHARLAFIPVITEVLRELDGSREPQGLIHHFAQERAIHLAIEVITDVGSLLIDGFILRDASSYEDIVDILRTEGVLPDDTANRYVALIGLRRALTQQYMELDRTRMRADLSETAELLEQFSPLVTAFIEKELQGF